MFNRADGRSTGTTIVAGDQYHIGLGFGHAGCNRDRKSTRLNSSHSQISYAVFCLKKKITLEMRLIAEALIAASTSVSIIAMRTPCGRHLVAMRLMNTPLWLYLRSVRSSDMSFKL